jgi:hypothetical protein
MSMSLEMMSSKMLSLKMMSLNICLDTSKLNMIIFRYWCHPLCANPLGLMAVTICLGLRGNRSGVVSAHEFRRREAGEWENLTPKQRLAPDISGCISTHPLDELQPGGGLAVFYYLDDGTIFCFPSVVVPFLRAFDFRNVRAGGGHNHSKSHVFMCAFPDDMEAYKEDWELEALWTLATLHHPDEGAVSLGVAIGPLAHRRKQIQQTNNVVEAMREQMQIVVDTQIELWEFLG